MLTPKSDMRQRIIAIDNNSIAEELGIKPGFSLLRINGEPVEDVIDYEQLTAETSISLELETDNGEVIEADVEKDEYEPLGLYFESGLMSPVRSCKNKCVFCFIDQMPKGGRETLHFKDDDWRLSLIMGNYVSLTNVNDKEFDRMLRRRVSPLYISIHATDGDIRKRMMANPTAGRIMERLYALKEAGLSFHGQIVVCPELNDGESLKKSIRELYALRPAAQTLALVPVGITKFRQGLYPLRLLTKQEASDIIDYAEAFNKMVLDKGEEGFVYASDEMYMIAQRELPSYESYGEFLQIENGVGLLRQFEHGFNEALKQMEPIKKKVKLAGATGVSARGFLQSLFDKLLPYGIELKLNGIRNEFFGHTITVSGLVTAGDIAAALKGITADALLIPDDMLRERDSVFLDGHDTAWLEKELDIPLWPMSAADGEEFVYDLFDRINEEN